MRRGLAPSPCAGRAGGRASGRDSVRRGTRVRARAGRSRRGDRSGVLPRFVRGHDQAGPNPGHRGRLSIESAIRDAVKERYPGDSVLGEEGGLQGEGRRRWIVDPIDGTKNFADGVQIWSNLIALAVDDEPVLGVVNLPALGERYDASRGGGARMNGAPIHVSRADRVPRSFVVFAGMGDWLSGSYAAGVQTPGLGRAAGPRVRRRVGSLPGGERLGGRHARARAGDVGLRGPRR